MGSQKVPISATHVPSLSAARVNMFKFKPRTLCPQIIVPLNSTSVLPGNSTAK